MSSSRLDAVLDRYGGFGAVGRKDQMSNRFLSEEFRQLQRFAEIFPAIFIGVAAFLLNVVISRIINTQREQIAALKAIGYSNLDVGIHYAKLVLFIVLIGVVCGTAAGVWLGKGLGRIYMEFYRFPYLMYRAQAPGRGRCGADHRRRRASGHASLGAPGGPAPSCPGHAARAADPL